ncbi:MAG: triose-phosphate isomerase [Saprospiraceae bacterium]|nr:triose-phosphate isomerase [Saprospiraceae bacterium]
MQSKRQKVVAANWKMNVLPSKAMDLIHQYDISFNESFPQIIVCAPFTNLSNLLESCEMGYFLGAQNCSSEKLGAYTGEIAPEMLVDLNCTHVLIGHSEARQRNPNENLQIPAKIRRAIDCGLKVIYCCGEQLEARNLNQESTFVESQLQADLAQIDIGDLKNLIIAYEPIWAIGTGQHATSEQAQDMHSFIRVVINDKFQNQASSICILYGGSVTAINAIQLSQMPDIDGVLVGGSSLKPVEFKSICEAFIYQ